YDHVLDAAVAVGAVPARFQAGAAPGTLDAYFAMARGGRTGGREVAPLELTKWFDTNYHYLVPELAPDTRFCVDPAKPLRELSEITAAERATVKVVMVGPLSMLLLSSPAHPGFGPLGLADALAGAYLELLEALTGAGATWVQLDEPVLTADLDGEGLAVLERIYRRLGETPTRPKVALSTYFGSVGSAMGPLADLPVEGIGLDFCAGAANLELLRAAGGLADKTLFAGVVDGRNVWAADLDAAGRILDDAATLADEVVVSTSCSLLHVPWTTAGDTGIDPSVVPWLAFGLEKLGELRVLAQALDQGKASISSELDANRAVLAARRGDPRRSDPAVRARLSGLRAGGDRRPGTAESRRATQDTRLGLPLLPTTTIGSFPQTAELRAARASWRAGRLDDDAYHAHLRAAIDRVVALQEEVGLDVLVHGEPERDDMVRYFAAQLSGFTLPDDGWVQSYGSRCTRPAVLYGDVCRPAPITIGWTIYAASLTSKPVKGMLTGPVTMLRWSFVRDDQPFADTAYQLALAIGDEVADLQEAGIAVIQVDEPALREGLPLRRAERDAYLAWATRAFRLAVASAGRDTQVHTHMCYSEFSGILSALAELEVDVISLEAARSQAATVEELAGSSYQGGIGPGVYDVHSPQVPSVDEMTASFNGAILQFGAGRVWANPDCGLKTRDYGEVIPALRNLVTAAHQARAAIGTERWADRS
ncbi:MAG: 5-methyltetrahydropteroyltriglutamate--homocysteine S-methyltransferase, partial [Acidimicrobiales bacterium]